MLRSVVELPFNRLVGIRNCSTGEALLELGPGEQFMNHLGTVHAGAQLALAEACSGEFLLRSLSGSVDLVPVVRRLEAKFKKPAHGKIVARAVTSQDAVEAARLDVENKGRALLTIEVNVHDESGQHTLAANVEWFIAKGKPA